MSNCPVKKGKIFHEDKMNDLKSIVSEISN